MARTSHLDGVRRSLSPGLLIALVSLGLNFTWAMRIRPLNAPDESAYLQTVMQVRDGDVLPEIHFGFRTRPQGQVIDTPRNRAAVAYIRRQGFDQPSVRELPYEAVQPPLYFWLAGGVARLARQTPESALYVSRMLTALFAAAAVYLAWASVREVAPGAPLWAAGSALAIAALPEFCFDGAHAGNDSLALCLAMAVLLVALRGLRRTRYDPWLLRAGSLLGLGLLSKLTTVLLLPGLALVVAFRAWAAGEGPHRVTARLRCGLELAAGCAGAVSVVAGWWFVRNVFVYGEPSGTRAINRFWHLNLPLFDWHDPATRADLVRATWRSFWGFFGWQTIGMPEWAYQAIFWISLVLIILTAFAGAHLFSSGRWRRVPAYTWQGAAVLVAVVAAVVFGYLHYNVTVAYEPQGRYLFLALLPAALVFTAGLYALVPGRTTKALALALPVGWLAALNWIGLTLVD